jgi:NADPH:quinone reductase-like Zn-dependent oxidoreductase
MLSAYVSSPDPDSPLDALEVGDRPEPEAPDGWATVEVKAASLNHHDIWSLRGVGLPEERMPMILGCDAAGLDADGNEVVVHAIVGDEDWRGDETLDPKRSLLSEKHQGTLAEKVVVPARNLIPLPAGMSLEQAACMPTAWLTAYRMLFVAGDLAPGQTVLVQGATGGVASAAIKLGTAAGLTVWVTSRTEAKPGGKLVVAGATSGMNPPAELPRVFFLQLQIIGSTMGSKEELERLLRFCSEHGVEPEIDRTLPLSDAREGFAAMEAGELVGKVVFRP